MTPRYRRRSGAAGSGPGRARNSRAGRPGSPAVLRPVGTTNPGVEVTLRWKLRGSAAAERVRAVGLAEGDAETAKMAAYQGLPPAVLTALAVRERPASCLRSAS